MAALAQQTGEDPTFQTVWGEAGCHLMLWTSRDPSRSRILYWLEAAKSVHKESGLCQKCLQ